MFKLKRDLPHFLVICLFISDVYSSCPALEIYEFDYEQKSCPDYVDPRMLQNGAKVHIYVLSVV